MVDVKESFYNYKEPPLEDLYKEWDFNNVWSDKYNKNDYPVLLWQVEEEEEEQKKTTSRSPQRVVPWYQNPLYAQELEDIKNDLETIQEMIDEIIIVANDIYGVNS